MSSADDTAWFLAQLRPNFAQIAKQNLQQHGLESFLPMTQETVRKGGRFISDLRPLFPGYIFVALDVTQGAWRRVNPTYGVTRLVRLGKYPT